MKLALCAIFGLILFGCQAQEPDSSAKMNQICSDPALFADEFQFPVGPPDAEGYYNAQGFGENRYLGDDWNGTGGGSINPDPRSPILYSDHLVPVGTT